MSGDRRKVRGYTSSKRTLRRWKKAWHKWRRRAPARFTNSWRRSLKTRQKDLRRWKKTFRRWEKTFKRWEKITARWRREVDDRVNAVRKRGWNQVWIVLVDRGSASPATSRDRVLHELARQEADEVRAFWRAFGDPRIPRHVDGTREAPDQDDDPYESKAKVE